MRSVLATIAQNHAYVAVLILPPAIRSYSRAKFQVPYCVACKCEGKYINCGQVIPARTLTVALMGVQQMTDCNVYDVFK